MIRRLRRLDQPAVGSVDFGDLASVRPISRSFGYDRGTPVDRFYIEAFLQRFSADIRGRVLEVGDSGYSSRFGTGISRQDVLNVHERKDATIVADLTRADALPADAFDCIIATQTLQFIYDVQSAVEQLHRGLAPGGLLVATMPGVSSFDPVEWGGAWFWCVTELTAKRLFGHVFGPENVEIVTYGNVHAATCFLHGLAVEDVDRDRLSFRDSNYPVIVAIAARRRGS